MRRCRRCRRRSGRARPASAWRLRRSPADEPGHRGRVLLGPAADARAPRGGVRGDAAAGHRRADPDGRGLAGPRVRRHHRAFVACWLIWLEHGKLAGSAGFDAAVNAAPGGAASPVRLVRDRGRLTTITSDPPAGERQITVTTLYVRPDGPQLARWQNWLTPARSASSPAACSR